MHCLSVTGYLTQLLLILGLAYNTGTGWEQDQEEYTRASRGAPLKAVIGVAHAIAEQAAAHALQNRVVPSQGHPQ